MDDQWFLQFHYWDAYTPYVPLSDHPEVVRDWQYPDSDTAPNELRDLIEGSWCEHQLRTMVFGRGETLGDVFRKYDAGAWYVDQQFRRLLNHQRTGNSERRRYSSLSTTARASSNRTSFSHIRDSTTPRSTSHSRYAAWVRGRETTFVNTPTSIRRSLTPSTGDDASVFDGVSLVPGRDARDLERDTVYAEQGHRTRKRSIRIGSFKCFDLPDD